MSDLCFSLILTFGFLDQKKKKNKIYWHNQISDMNGLFLAFDYKKKKNLVREKSHVKVAV